MSYVTSDVTTDMKIDVRNKCEREEVNEPNLQRVSNKQKTDKFSSSGHCLQHIDIIVCL